VSNYVVDTTFVIDYLRDDPLAIARFARFFADGDNVLVNEIVVCEARVCLTAAQVPGLMAMLLPLEFIQPGPEAALNAGRWRGEVRRTGRNLSLADALIAAAADTTDATVLTRNVRDFSLTPARVESY
jgi:predicted nucleic acid-binding protein